MCFSATASFIASGILFIIGVLALRHLKKKEYFLFACIPLLFALQQFSEGLLWLVLTTHVEYYFSSYLLARVYLFFALVLWPTLVPLSLLQIEKHASRKFILKIILGIGVLWSLYLFYSIGSYATGAGIQGQCIVYSFANPLNFSSAFKILYVLIIVGSFFATHLRPLWIFGSVVGIAAAVSYFIWQASFISVWCFFAAIVSIGVLYVLQKPLVDKKK